ncbi:ankyrin repeat-containing domain protein [Mycena latifolia]|nr:ankyrin repeat-containing domain protein [Mycena latifolia]
MADLVGILASILQLIDTVAKAVVYTKDFKNAPKEQQKLLSEVQSVEPLLRAFRTQIQGHNCSEKVKDPLIHFEETMKHLVEVLGLKGPKVLNQLTYTLWNKKEILENLEKIERFKSLLNAWSTLEIWNEQRKVNDSADRDRRIEWLSPLNFFPRQAEIFGARELGTGKWLLEDERFQAWKSGSGKVMWCRGIPGAGKTVLASLVVNHLQNSTIGDKVGVACIYLDHKETQAHSPSNLLASLWRQLILGKPIPPSVHELFQNHHERRTRPSLNDTQEVLRSAVAEYSQVYVIVDALDEYPEDLRDILLHNLGKLGPTVSLMLTSRPHINIDTSFPAAHILEIRATEDDVRLYVQARILKSSRLSKHVSTRPELREEIERKIADSVHGMFLLAKLHIDSLATKLTVKAVRETLQHLPKDLAHTYNEAMERINSQNEDERHIARLVLIWITNAKRPLHVSELQEALAVEPGARTLDEDNILDIDVMLSVCGGLVIVNETDLVARLVHYTAQECLTYLSFTTFADLPQLRHALIAYAIEYCLVHAGGEPETVFKDSLLKFLEHDFWRFSQFRWGTQSPWHYGSLWVTAFFNLQEIARYLLAHDATGNVLCVASDLGHVEIVKMLIQNGANVNTPRRKELCDTALYAASFNGHEESGADVNAEGGRLGAALDAASWGGHEGVIKLLIQNGANLSSHEAAAFKGHETAVKLLLDTGGIDAALLIEGGADVNQQGCRGSALQSVARVLISSGADVNARGDTLDSALYAASFNGHEAVVRLLLDNGADFGSALQAASAKGNEAMGADVNIKGGRLDRLIAAREHGGHDIVFLPVGTALQVAAARGHAAVVQLLIESGADVNAEGQVGSALQAASAMGHYSVAKLLVENGADVDPVIDRRGESPLYAASFNGHEGVVQLLLERGADIHARGGNFGGALQAASKSGHESVGANVNSMARVEYTALDTAAMDGHDKGADVNAARGAALQTASEEGHMSLVQLLIANGADIKRASAHGNVEIAQLLLGNGGYHETALHAASKNGRNGGIALQAASLMGHKGVVQLLLEHGADVNAQGGHWGTGLQAASYNGSAKMVRLLLENGADINAQGGHENTAGHQNMVHLLLKHGADVNAQGGYSGTALQAAACKGSVEVVRLLLENGANINAQGGHYNTALQGASSMGHTEVVRVLLEQGAAIYAQGGPYGNALRAASFTRKPESIENERCQGTALQAASLSGNAEVTVNAKGGHWETSLQAASHSGSVEVVRLLLENGADVNNAQGGQTATPLQLASVIGNGKMARLLLEHGADVNAQGEQYGNALSAASSAREECVDLVRLLLENGADVNAQGGRQNTALQEASSMGHENVVRLLLEHGADVNAQRRQSGTCHGADINAQGGQYGNALNAALQTWKENVKMVRLLLENGADVNAQGEITLQAASSKGHENVVRLLLEHGADVNARGGIALQAASSKGREKVVRLLLDHGADVNAQGGIALQAASSEGHDRVVQLLLKQGAADVGLPVLLLTVAGH